MKITKAGWVALIAIPCLLVLPLLTADNWEETIAYIGECPRVANGRITEVRESSAFRNSYTTIEYQVDGKTYSTSSIYDIPCDLDQATAAWSAVVDLPRLYVGYSCANPKVATLLLDESHFTGLGLQVPVEFIPLAKRHYCHRKPYRFSW